MMKVNIVKITDRGVGNKERLHISVLAATNLVYYLVFSTPVVGSDQIRARPNHAFWFPDTQVLAGDTVILYTKPGENSSQRRSDGGFNRFFYWGLDKTIWHDTRETAVLLEISDWQTVT